MEILKVTKRINGKVVSMDVALGSDVGTIEDVVMEVTTKCCLVYCVINLTL